MTSTLVPANRITLPLSSNEASPRASIALVTGARALAFLYGRDYVLPDDVRELALDVMRHRIVLSADAQLDGRKIDDQLHDILEATAAPRA